MQIILPTWLGSYYGAEFSFNELEFRTITSFKEPVRKIEMSLYQTKWFDYVRLHPLQATYYFTECYRKIYNRLSIQFFGEGRFGYKNKNQDFLESRERTSFWTARASADSIGVPYPWFISRCMELRLQSGEFKNRLPRPCHLAQPDDLLLLKEAWDQETNGTILCVASDPFFCVKRWLGTPEQTRHEDFLVRQVKRRAVKRFALSTLIYEKQVLRIERALKEFPREVSDAQREAEFLTPHDM